MKLDVYFTPGELAAVELPARVVVIDVLRATSTMVEALANGARTVFPVGTADDAAKIAQNIGRDSVLLCGERKGLSIEGFDLGNSPLEFHRKAVAGKALVMTTTNGTRAFVAVAERRGGVPEADSLVVPAAFLNLGAVTALLAEPRSRTAGETGAAAASAPRGKAAATPDAVAVVCAGREGRFALEDAVCAGGIVRGLEAEGVALDPNDAALAAGVLADQHLPELEKMMAGTAAGAQLTGIGRAEDLAFCATMDRTDIVPRFRDRKITLE